VIKLIGAFSKRRELSRADCLAHYRERHGPLIRDTREFGRHINRYLQYDRADVEEFNAENPDVCGVSQVWFADLTALRAAFAEPAYMDTIRPDEVRFSDLATPMIVIGSETTPLYGGDDAPVRLFRFLHSASTDENDFFNFRQENYAPAIMKDAELAPLIAGYVQTRGLANDDNPFESAPTFAALDEFRFRELRDVNAFLERDADLSRRLDSMRYIDFGRQVKVITMGLRVMI